MERHVAGPIATLKVRRIRRRLLAWYARHARRLPWRERPSPYRTWISEIMLQQTTVKTVVPRYREFLRRFPSVRSLARAREDDVLRRWAGLGYYSRARNLHRAARLIMAGHGGRFPEDPAALRRLPGVGDYTAGAILSIAFGKAYPVVDGNVERVLSRLFLIRGDLRAGPGRRRAWSLATALLDTRRPGDWNQALMELGALICGPQSPLCGECPLSADCLARKAGLQEALPRARERAKPVNVSWTSLWMERNGSVLLWRRDPDERFLPGHWGLPEPRHFGRRLRPGRLIGRVEHSITHHSISVEVREASPPSGPLPPEARWVPRSSLRRRLVSSLWLKAAGFRGGRGPARVP